ncbi:NAD(P)-binding domain-containing protein [Acidobacterium sp. S8]|uniref:NAD(P)-binding domain-containing protein n=1 Tax=Acidobacterium sp. S8 TaxID=1641854 RepID=UPI00352E0892
MHRHPKTHSKSQLPNILVSPGFRVEPWVKSRLRLRSRLVQTSSEGELLMTIGMIGAGSVAMAFARYLLASGHEVELSNSRGPDTLARQLSELGSRARAAYSFRRGREKPVMTRVY